MVTVGNQGQDLPQQYSCEMAATKLTADGLLSTEETDPATEDTRMDTDMSHEEDALLSCQGEDIGSSNQCPKRSKTRAQGDNEQAKEARAQNQRACRL